MLKKIYIRDFRSIETAEITLAPITVIYGPTASGKSSLLYALLVLRNFILNPNRQVDGFFHLGFMDLGGYEACVFNHDIQKSIGISFEYISESQAAFYGIAFNKTSCRIQTELDTFKMDATVNIPYSLNQTFPFIYTKGEEEYTVNWNGITCSAIPKQPTAENQMRAQEIAALLNAPSEILRKIDIAPHKRGFFKPTYAPVSPSLTPTTEDEVASIIMNDLYLAGRISTYAEDVFGRDFRIQILPGTATAYFTSTDKKSRIPVLLVNDGFGVNQVIYIFAKMLRADVSTILIEEPEIHLHPTVIRNFARALCMFVTDTKKQIICTTHSEQFLAALLTALAEGLFESNDIRCYLTKKNKRTDIIKQEVNKDGQIEGGLISFMEAQVEDLKRFLGDKKKNG